MSLYDGLHQAACQMVQQTIKVDLTRSNASQGEGALLGLQQTVACGSKDTC